MKSTYQSLKGCFYNLLNFLIPKKKNRIFLHTGLGYRDNIKAIGDYLAENNYLEKYEVICGLPNSNDENLVPSGFQITTNKIRSYFSFFRSKYVFYCFGQLGAKPCHQMTIDMWHGTPLKKIKNLEDNVSEDFFNFTYVLAASDLFRPIFAQAFGCPEENVKICGHPRNDVLFKENPFPMFVNDKKYILWTPTFRKSNLLNTYNGQQDRLIPVLNNSDLLDLDEYLDKNRIDLVIKLHPIEDCDSNTVINYKRIHIFTHEQFINAGYELYSVASNSSALITDYSSLAFDYMLLDRPIGYTVDDIEQYSDNRGFIFNNPYEFMPGSKIKEKRDLYNFINDVIIGCDKYKVRRNEINDKVNKYQDGTNCKRVLDIAGIKIEGN